MFSQRPHVLDTKQQGRAVLQLERRDVPQLVVRVEARRTGEMKEEIGAMKEEMGGVWTNFPPAPATATNPWEGAVILV